jgi:hypothetical protein
LKPPDSSKRKVNLLILLYNNFREEAVDKRKNMVSSQICTSSKERKEKTKALIWHAREKRRQCICVRKQKQKQIPSSFPQCFSPLPEPNISNFGPLHLWWRTPNVHDKKKEKAAYVNYEKEAGDGWEGRMEKRKGEFRWGVSERRRRGRWEETDEREGKSHDDASASSSGLVAIAACRSGATAAAAFAFCWFCVLFVVDDVLRFDAHVYDVGRRVAESTVCWLVS